MLKPFSEEFLASCKRGFTFEIIADQIKTKYEILTQEGECGILKMVGPKMQDFCPRINMLKGKFFKKILR